jgi:hypothetical protein
MLIGPVVTAAIPGPVRDVAEARPLYCTILAIITSSEFREPRIIRPADEVTGERGALTRATSWPSPVIET